LAASIISGQTCDVASWPIGEAASITVRGWASLPVPRRKRRLLIPIAHHRHYGRAVWIDPVVLRAITISWNNIRIPVRPYHRHRDDKPLPWWWFTNDFGRPRLGYATKRPQVTQHQGRSESERCGHYPHASASLPQRQINGLRGLVQVQLRGLKSDGWGRRQDRGALIAGALGNRHRRVRCEGAWLRAIG
jgi:hypothetical protein